MGLVPKRDRAMAKETYGVGWVLLYVGTVLAKRAHSGDAGSMFDNGIRAQEHGAG